MRAGEAGVCASASFLDIYLIRRQILITVDSFSSFPVLPRKAGAFVLFTSAASFSLRSAY